MKTKTSPRRRIRPRVEQPIEQSVDLYVAAWNEPQGDAREALLQQCCAPEVRITSRGGVAMGYAALDELIQGFHRRRPSEAYRRTSALEVQGRAFRYLARVDSTTTDAPAESVDLLEVGECGDDGRIVQVFSFVGAEPPSLPVEETHPELAEMVGTWSIVGNGYTGRLELQVQKGQLVGRVLYDTYNVWEPLTGVSYVERTIVFTRPGPMQVYTGTCLDGVMTGTFTHEGSGAYLWTARDRRAPRT